MYNSGKKRYLSRYQTSHLNKKYDFLQWRVKLLLLHCISEAEALCLTLHSLKYVYFSSLKTRLVWIYPSSVVCSGSTCSTVSRQVGLLESRELRVTLQQSSVVWCAPLYHVACCVIIRRARVEEDVPVQILCYTKSLPPSFIHPATNKMALWLNQQDRLISCQQSTALAQHRVSAQ